MCTVYINLWYCKPRAQLLYTPCCPSYIAYTTLKRPSYNLLTLLIHSFYTVSALFFNTSRPLIQFLYTYCTLSHTSLLCFFVYLLFSCAFLIQSQYFYTLSIPLLQVFYKLSLVLKILYILYISYTLLVHLLYIY